ncbi:hypothetical protein BCV71DRAFT_272337 [Rhizopus microsporus]|uniref:Uncharacterized protein n=1 Tax=Rhizopus microsporus TaxID=58291 RepID=A0A1X0RW51_RHIZD|nr:hypothetical protein BCV71DRAFT_272337 [Rhizopus microsporus]
MYNQRRQQLQAQILQPDDIDTPQYGTASVDTSVKPTTTTTTVITASTQVPNFVSLKQVELDISKEKGFYNIKHVYSLSLETKKRIPKNTSFEPLSELASQNFRDLLTREYRKTISNVLQDTPNVSQHQVEYILRPVVTAIDRKLKQLLFPGNIDPNMLNMGLDQLVDDARKDMEAQYQQVAHDVGIKVRDREEALSREQNQLDEWRQKNINARKALRERPFAFQPYEDVNDYVQNLLKYPSHSVLDL